MKGTHRGRTWKYHAKKNEKKWDGKSDSMDKKSARRRRRRMYDGIKRMSIYNRDGRKCVDCKRSLGPEEFIIGHIKPLSEGGTNHPSNLICVCEECEDKRHERVRRAARPTTRR